MHVDTLDLKKLKAFQLAAQHGSLRVAASRLNLTVPAVSFQIRRLETDLGVALFQRLPNRLVLTDAGKRFVSEVDGVFARVEQAVQTLAPIPRPAGRLAIATSTDLFWFFTPRISNFINRFPDVELHHRVYTSGESLQRVADGELDAGIGYFPRIPKGLAKETVIQSGLSLACRKGHPLLRRPPRLEEIVRYKLLLSRHESAAGRMVLRKFADAKLPIDNFIEAGTCHVARAFAEHGTGVAIVHSLCMTDAPAGNLRCIDLDHHFGKIDFSIVYRKEKKLSEAMQGLLEDLTNDKALNPAAQG